MKHCKLIVLCISSIAIVICAVMIIRINVLYPNAEVIVIPKIIRLILMVWKLSQ